MRLLDYLEQCGISQRSLAEKINLNREASITDWKNGIREVPITFCPAIEQATNGAVTRKDLRPDDWWKIWPELEDK